MGSHLCGDKEEACKLRTGDKVATVGIHMGFDTLVDPCVGNLWMSLEVMMQLSALLGTYVAIKGIGVEIAAKVGL